jgi:integrase/recombinase XerC
MAETDLQRYSGTRIARAEAWVHLSESDRRREASIAANDRDLDALWSLAEAYLVLHGAQGVRVSPSTLKNYRTGIRDLLRDWQGVNLLRPERDAGVLWARRLETRLKPSTVQVKLSAARMLYRALRWSGATASVPFGDVKVAKDKTPQWKKRGAYSRDELDLLLATAEGPDLLLVLLGAHAGLRISEMCDLRWEDIRFGEGELVVRRGKGGKRDTVVMSPRLARALGRAERSGDAVLPWGSYYARERFQALCAAAGVAYDGRAVHGLRHAAGTHLYEAVGDLGQVADHLRHADVNTTRGYAKRNTDRIRRALDDW